MLRYIGIPIAAVLGLVAGYLIGQTHAGPGELTFADHIGKALANGVVKLTTLSTVTVPIVLAVAGLLRIQAVRLWITRAFEGVLVGLLPVRQLREAMKDGLLMSQVPMSAAVLAGLSIMGLSIFAGWLIAALIGLIGALA